VKVEHLYVDLGSSTCDVATCGITITAKFKENNCWPDWITAS